MTKKYEAKAHATAVGKLLTARYQKTGLVFLSGAATFMYANSDMLGPFRQNRHFFYLSGVNEPDCHLTYDIEKDLLRLWLPKQRTQREILYMGPVLTPEVALKTYDIDAVALSDKLEDFLLEYLGQPGSRLFILREQLPSLREVGLLLGDYLEAKGSLDTKLLQPTIDACRVIKTNQELDYIKIANKITALAHIEVLKNIKNMDNETVAEGVYIGTCIAAKAKSQAYEPIVGSGPNASTLHYMKNDEDFGNREALLIDAGCEWACYACDVTRTFPISGEWTKEGQAIYGLVEKMQETCINHMRAGVLFRDVNVLAHVVAVTGLLELGILKGGSVDELLKKGLSTAFMPHGLGHHVGLEVHDVDDVEQPILSFIQRPFGLSPVHGHSGRFSYDVLADPLVEFDHFRDTYGHLFEKKMHLAPLGAYQPCTAGMRPGMVITVEPGLYFNEFGLGLYLKDPELSHYIDSHVLKRYMTVGGVRIEDDILITNADPDNLTTTPKGDEALKIIAKGSAFIADPDSLVANTPSTQFPSSSPCANIVLATGSLSIPEAKRYIFK